MVLINIVLNQNYRIPPQNFIIKILTPAFYRFVDCFLKKQSDIKVASLSSSPNWEYGEIGKHAGFKILCRKASRFKSEYSHQ